MVVFFELSTARKGSAIMRVVMALRDGVVVRAAIVWGDQSWPVVGGRGCCECGERKKWDAYLLGADEEEATFVCSGVVSEYWT